MQTEYGTQEKPIRMRWIVTGRWLDRTLCYQSHSIADEESETTTVEVWTKMRVVNTSS